jgi:hypothetical protein
MMLTSQLSDMKTEETQIRSGEHHQIWMGKSLQMVIMFPSDEKMMEWVQDLYSKTIAAMPDGIFAVEITDVTDVEITDVTDVEITDVTDVEITDVTDVEITDVTD